MQDFYDVIAISLTALAALFSYLSAKASRKSSERASEAAQLISKMEFKLQYHNEVRLWATYSIECIGELLALCYLAPKRCDFNYRVRQVTLINKMSSIIDSGRWFFPNNKSTGVGLYKAKAYQGYRHPVLDQLVDVYDIALEIDYKSGKDNSVHAKKLKTEKRKFVSLIQGYIQTEDWVKVIEQIDSQQSPNNSMQRCNPPNN